MNYVIAIGIGAIVAATLAQATLAALHARDRRRAEESGLKCF